MLVAYVLIEEATFLVFYFLKKSLLYSFNIEFMNFLVDTVFKVYPINDENMFYDTSNIHQASFSFSLKTYLFERVG